MLIDLLKAIFCGGGREGGGGKGTPYEWSKYLQ